MGFEFDVFVEIIDSHFPNTTMAQREEISSNLLGHWNSGRTLSKIERSNHKPSKDIVALEEAAKQLKHASKSLKTIGWHGGVALLPFAKEYAKAQKQINWYPQLGITDSAEFIGVELDRIAGAMDLARLQIDPSGASVFDYLDESFQKGGDRQKMALSI